MILSRGQNFEGSDRVELSKVKLREIVLERDKHKCVECGESRKKLDVHHIDGNKENNRLENLMTLCCRHHAKIHNERSRQNGKSISVT